MVNDVSNEVSGSAAAGQTIALNWTDPTRAVTGACLARSDIEFYLVQYGDTSEVYNSSFKVPLATDPALSCTASLTTDGDCGAVYECAYSFVRP